MLGRVARELQVGEIVFTIKVLYVLIFCLFYVSNYYLYLNFYQVKCILKYW